jgi:hypothetical protein
MVMSVCGGCPYPFESVLAGDCDTQEEACDGGCCFEDAAYRKQWAYDQLYERYKALEDEKRALEQKLRQLELRLIDDGK